MQDITRKATFKISPPLITTTSLKHPNEESHSTHVTFISRVKRPQILLRASRWQQIFFLLLLCTHLEENEEQESYTLHNWSIVKISQSHTHTYCVCMLVFALSLFCCIIYW